MGVAQKSIDYLVGVGGYMGKAASTKLGKSFIYTFAANHLFHGGLEILTQGERQLNLKDYQGNVFSVTLQVINEFIAGPIIRMANGDLSPEWYLTTGLAMSTVAAGVYLKNRHGSTLHNAGRQHAHSKETYRNDKENYDESLEGARTQLAKIESSKPKRPVI